MRDNKISLLLAHIGNELKFLWCQMDAWQELFDVEHEKRRALIQATAPGFFAVVQATLAESILMRIARLMDPPESMGHDNSSVSSLRDALSSSSHGCLRSDIQSLTNEWAKKDQQTNAEQGEYASLKVLRNKWLAHNDSAIRQDQPPDSLWMPLTHADFALARRLAGKLWSIYRQAHLNLKNADVLEPQHSSLENRPSMVLKQLCAGQYLNHLIETMPDELQCARVAELHAFEQQHMGEDRIRKVFDIDQAAVRCGTTGEPQ